MPAFLPGLRRNLKALGDNVALEPSFVADDESRMMPAEVQAAGGTASVSRAVRAGTLDGGIRTRSPRSIVREHTRYSRPRLLKADTDGLDFRILQLSHELIAEACPVIFFEYYLDADDGAEDEALAAVESLSSIGYRSHFEQMRIHEIHLVVE